MYDELLTGIKNDMDFSDSRGCSARDRKDSKNTKPDQRIAEKSTKRDSTDKKNDLAVPKDACGNTIFLPLPIEKLIGLLCADYPRRDSVIKERTAPYNVIMEYRFLNYRILSAATEIAGSRDALEFIGDIGNDTGYASSELWILTERVYKERKGAVKHNIARRLSLI